MEFSIGYVKSEQQLIVKRFSDGQVLESKIISMEEVKEVELNGLLFDGQISEATLNSLRDEFKFYPIIKSETVQMAATVFESVSFENALSLLKKMQTSWVLQNNLTLLEEFFSVL